VIYFALQRHLPLIVAGIMFIGSVLDTKTATENNDEDNYNEEYPKKATIKETTIKEAAFGVSHIFHLPY
jgi:hypothetical protein